MLTAQDDVNQTLQDLMQPHIPQEIRAAILSVIEFLQRGQAIKMPESVFSGAMQCVSQMYAGDLTEPVPALALYVRSQMVLTISAGTLKSTPSQTSPQRSSKSLSP